MRTGIVAVMATAFPASIREPVAEMLMIDGYRVVTTLNAAVYYTMFIQVPSLLYIWSLMCDEYPLSPERGLPPPGSPMGASAQRAIG